MSWTQNVALVGNFHLVNGESMSWTQKCDICGAEIYDKMRGTLQVLNFNDGYNTDDYHCELDICKDCILEKFDKQYLENGRTF